MNKTYKFQQSNNRPTSQPAGSGHNSTGGIEFFLAPSGLTPEQVEKSRREHGSNQMSQHKGPGFVSRLLKNLTDPVIRILLGALVINILFTLRDGDWIECVGIGVSVVLATLISTLSEQGSENAFKRLSRQVGQEFCRVRRSRGVVNLPVSDVVVGDVVLLAPGDRIPADGFMVSGKIGVDQSALTGESQEIFKAPATRGRLDVSCLTPSRLEPSATYAVFRGCAVMNGEGEAVIARVGDATMLGEISREVQAETRASPLKIRLAKLAKQISILGYIMAALVIAVSIADAVLLDSGWQPDVILSKLEDWRFMLSTLLHALTLGLTVIVVAVPEGLPMMIAVVLSANIRRMVRDQVLVRRPVGIEAAGSMNILFTDKTGTLTEGRLTVGEIYAGNGRSFQGTDALRRRGGEIYNGFCRGCLYNNSAVVGADGISGGNSTDRALLSALPPGWSGGARVVKRQPFDSARKYSSAALSDGRVLVKGAPELLLPYVRDIMTPDGTPRPADSAAISAWLSGVNRTGARTLMLAEGRRGLSPDQMGGLTLICVVTLEDHLRREAPGAVSELRGAGIHVVMITGDSRETAEAIARRCGIIGRGVDMCLSGDELARMSDHKLSELLPRIGVIARALPTDKSRLVRISQEAGLVTGMTGDGINDAPALKRADIGFAMGSGTQVAKDAGDIIILDNNLASVCRAVLYGRNIFKSIRKFITLQLTMNFCAVGVSMAGPFIGIDAPVTVVQMLWINIIMDTLGGLAFAGEPPLQSCMRERPKRRDEPILNRYMVNEIVLLGGFTVGLCLLFLKLPGIAALFRPAPDNIYLLTAFFALFIFASVFNCFNARTDRLRLLAGISGNPTFVSIMAAVLTVQLIFVYLGGSVLRTAPLTLRELGITMLLSLAVFPADFIRKLLWRFFRGRRGY